VLTLRSVHPGVGVDEVVESTGCDVVVPDEVPESRGPDAAEVTELERLDPGGLRFAEVPEP
jgi:hypothetical protein